MRGYPFFALMPVPPPPPLLGRLALGQVPRGLLFETLFSSGVSRPDEGYASHWGCNPELRSSGMENMVQLTDNRTSKGTITSMSNLSHPQIDLCTHAAHPNTTTSTAGTLRTCRIYTVHSLCPGIIMDGRCSTGGQRSCQIGGHVGRTRTCFLFPPFPKIKGVNLFCKTTAVEQTAQFVQL